MTLSSLTYTLSRLISNSAGIIDHQQGKLIAAFQEVGQLSWCILDLQSKVAEGEGRIQAAEEEMDQLCKFIGEYKALSGPPVCLLSLSVFFAID